MIKPVFEEDVARKGVAVEVMGPDYGGYRPFISGKAESAL